MIDGFKLGEYGPDFDGTELKLLNKLIYHFSFIFGLPVRLNGYHTEIYRLSNRHLEDAF